MHQRKLVHDALRSTRRDLDSVIEAARRLVEHLRARSRRRRVRRRRPVALAQLAVERDLRELDFSLADPRAGLEDYTTEVAI